MTKNLKPEDLLCLTLNPHTGDTSTSIKPRETKEMAVNTTPDLDPSFQKEAITDRCISLEKELLDSKKAYEELKHRNYNDYHNQIFKQELNTFKLENQNLCSTIELLQKENKQLLDELNQTKTVNRNCLNCDSTLDKHFQHPKRTSSDQPPRNENSFECATGFKFCHGIIHQHQAIVYLNELIQSFLLKEMFIKEILGRKNQLCQEKLQKSVV